MFSYMTVCIDKNERNMLTLCILESTKRVLWQSEDPDEMQHNAAFHQGKHCLLRLEQLSGTEIHHSLENLYL